MTQAVVEVGARLRYDGRTWTLAVLEGTRATLVSDEGASAVVLLPYLFTDPSFGVEGGPAPGRVTPFGLLEALPVEVRERALAWQRHVREVETGFPDAVVQRHSRCLCGRWVEGMLCADGFGRMSARLWCSLAATPCR